MTPSHQKKSNDLTHQEGQALVRIVRSTLAKQLKCSIGNIEAGASCNDFNAAIFQKKRATFVTLKKDGDLRGCIGCLVGTEPLLDSIKRNAVNAAFEDPRFPRVRAAELKRITIEVSILTDPKPLVCKRKSELIAKLQPGIDGVIIRKQNHSATFLPQVWDQLPTVESFLAHLCRKAGLSGDAWKDQDLEVLTYQVQKFKETA